jgi:hypothetical protein
MISGNVIEYFHLDPAATLAQKGTAAASRVDSPHLS